MQPIVELARQCASPVLWCSLVLCAGTGAMALFRPKWLLSANAESSRWIDSKKIFEWFDRQVHIDEWVLRHRRKFGVAALATSVLLAYVLFFVL